MSSSSLIATATRPVAEMMLPPPGMAFDFRHPSGERALLAADSLSWQIFKNPVTLFIGGVAAVILELAEPSVRSGVWDHSSFKRDPVMRLRRTGAAAMMTVYGPEGAARRMIARVVGLHGRVAGTTPAGTPYRANDPHLLDWVQATASFGFIEAYATFAQPLSRAERSRAFAEGSVPARLYGASGAPQSLEAWEALLARTLPGLERSETVFEFLSIMNEAPLMPRPLRPFQRMLVRAAITLVPPAVRTRLGLDGLELSWFGLRMVRMAAAIADQLTLPDAPPAQASMRLGLEADFLYR